MLGKLNLMKASWSLSSLAAKVGVVAIATTIGLANVVGSAGATLDAVATNTGGQSITSGVLSLTFANGNGGALTSGFSTVTSKVRPGDVITRYVNFTQAGDVTAMTPQIKIEDGNGTVLTTSATKGFQVVIDNCPGLTASWSDLGVCSTTSTQVLASTPLSSLLSHYTGISNFGLTANTVNHLRFTISLPDSLANDETVTNGQTIHSAAPGSDALSVQGKTAAIVWSIKEVQDSTPLVGASL